jgi:serine/threonine-protein kinase
MARFEREVQLTAKLTHPNTITIFDYGSTSDGVFYYAMELLEGATVEDVVERFGPQPPARVLRVLHMVAAALSEAHELDLMHRDIKPTNIFLCQQGGEFDVAKVLDFGLVKTVNEPRDSALTQEGAICGTPHYMAPESVSQPTHADARGDLYALGAVGYYMLTGQVVFDGASVIEVCSHHLSTPPTPPSERLGAPVPEDLEAVIMDCLEKLPTGRPQTARELKRRLEACRDIDGWDDDRARAWWEEHGESFGPAEHRATSDEFADTIAVALTGKGRTPRM